MTREFFTLRLAPRLCSWISPALWQRLLGVELLLPYWHVVSDHDLDHVSGLYQFRNVSQFTADIEFFLRHGKPVSLAEVLRFLDGSGQLPRRCFLPTFDDGFREIYDIVAPILHRQGVPAVFFLITSAIGNHSLCHPQKKSLLLRALRSRRGSSAEHQAAQVLSQAGLTGPDVPSLIRAISYGQRHILDDLAPILDCDPSAYLSSAKPYLTPAQVSELMRQGFTIGAHSLDHPLYAELSLAEQLWQTAESRRSLADQFQFNCEAFAFPFRDTGVTAEFFHQAFADNELKVSFGTGGLARHFFPRNLERFTMEKTSLPAAQIVARQFARRLFRRG